MHIANEPQVSNSHAAVAHESQIVRHSTTAGTRLVPDICDRHAAIRQPLINLKSLDHCVATNVPRTPKLDLAALAELPPDIRRHMAKIAVKDAYRSAFALTGWKSPVLMTATARPHPEGPAINRYAPDALSGNHLAEAGSRNLPRGVASLSRNHEMLVPMKLGADGKPQHVRSAFEGDPRMSYTVAYSERSADLPVGRLAQQQNVEFRPETYAALAQSADIEHAPTTRTAGNMISIRTGALRDATGKGDVPGLQIRRAALTPDSVLDDTMHAVATSAQATGKDGTPISIDASSQRYLQGVQADKNQTLARQLLNAAPDGTRSVVYDQSLTPQPAVGGALIGKRMGYESTLERTVTAEHLKAQFVRKDEQLGFDEPNVQ